MQQVSAPRTALAPISEARDGPRPSVAGQLPRNTKEPRRSLQQQQQQQLATEQARRNTLQLQDAAATAAAAAAERRRRSWRRTSSIRSIDSQVRAPGRQENSYRTGPAQPFQPEAAQALMQARLDRLGSVDGYTAQSAGNLAKSLAQEIKTMMKNRLGLQRYKLLVLVSVSEPAGPVGAFAARALWYPETRDGCAKAEFRSNRIAVSAVVFALYYE